MVRRAGCLTKGIVTLGLDPRALHFTTLPQV